MGPLFTLTSDFGSASSYPGQIKAVLLTAIPDARIVDVSHDVPAFDVLAAALILEAAVPWFPRDAIHLAVVDPGVGTARRGLVVADPEGRRLVGPDNGLFTPFLGRGARVRALVGQGGILPPPRTATFHGRDLFAPAAIYLARGGTAGALGPEISDPVLLDWPSAIREGNEIRGVMLAADPFGNVVTSIRGGDLAGAVMEVDVSGRRARFVRTFGEGERGELLALVGSGGRVEIAVREGSAARLLGAGSGMAVRIVLDRAHQA